MFNILSFIPDPFKQEIATQLVDFLAKQAEKFASDQLASQIRRWSTKGEFTESVNKAIKKGTERFISEYADEDEDLVAAFAANPDFLKSKSVQAAMMAIIKHPGGWVAKEHETLISNFEDVLPERRNRIRVNKAVAYFLRCITEELWTLPGAKEIHDIYVLQFQKISAESAQEQISLARQQLEATAQLSADIRQSLLQLTAAYEKNLLVSSLDITTEKRARPLNNLPRPDYKRFVGRNTELTWLRQRLLSSDRAWQIAITGIGGVGKSALALTIANEYRESYDNLPIEERFDAIIWISAKEEVLTAQGKEQASLPELVMRTLEDVYTTIARALEREEITRALPEDQGRVVEKVLKEQRTLLVMDNLESVKDERIKPFLRNLPAPTKAIITSREWLDVADIYPLKGMTIEDADNLICEEAQSRHINLDESQRKRIYELTFGLPLPIKLATARMAGGESFSGVERWLGDAVGDLPEYCIEGQAELVRKSFPNAWKLLLACSLFDRGAGASETALEYITDLSIVDRDQGLAQLHRLFLVNRSEKNRYWVLPIVQRYAQKKILENEFGKELSNKWLEWLANFAQTVGINLEAHFEKEADVENEYPNLLEAIRWARTEKEWDFLFKLSEGTCSYPYIKGIYNELEEIISATQVGINVTQNEQVLAYIEFQQGRLNFIWGQLDKAEAHLSSAAKRALKNNNELIIGDAWSLLIALYLLKNRLDDAENLAKKLIKRGERTNNPRFKYYGSYRLSSLETFRKNFDKANQWLDIAERWAKETGDQSFSPEIKYRRAAIHIAREDFVGAEPLLLQALEMNKSRGERRFIAADMHHLARIYLKSGQFQKAHQFAVEALEIFKSLGMATYANNATELLREIEQQVTLN